ncbi:MAG TPA: hypothetical protein VHX62_11835 [Solirubrobacteraceae bacterium]|jgi:hypothetical protein|nr:hypothetical protein [Solirubrobacteraceae bacterium]
MSSSRPIRRALFALVVAAALALPASALAAGFTAQLSAPNHRPIANKKWPITVKATRGTTQLAGTVSYRFLSYGTIVHTAKGGSFKHGVFHDTLVWPGEAVGHPLSLQVVVKTRYGTDYLSWWIQVRS